jgi:hypothetical protein
MIVRVDDRGLGAFSGPVRLVRPDGSLILEARLHGTIGLGDGPDADGACRVPGHLDGWLDPAATTVATDRIVPQVRFTADVVPETAGPTPVYKGSLLGLLEVPPARVPPVAVSTDRAVYAPSDPILVSVRNAGDRPVAAISGQSYCTIVRLQRRVNTGWEPVGQCNSLLPIEPVLIPPGETVRATLPPDPSRGPGEYRCAVTVSPLNADGRPADDHATFFSPVFRVQPAEARLVIAPDRRAYGARQPITAILRNGSLPVRILDEQSFCTIVQLQRLDGENWVEVAGCPLERIPLPTFLKPGETRAVTLPPANSLAPNWMPGRYRLAVTYTAVDSNGQPVGPEVLATSPPFPVGNVVVPAIRSHARAR